VKELLRRFEAGEEIAMEDLLSGSAISNRASNPQNIVDCAAKNYVVPRWIWLRIIRMNISVPILVLRVHLLSRKQADLYLVGLHQFKEATACQDALAIIVVPQPRDNVEKLTPFIVIEISTATPSSARLHRINYTCGIQSPKRVDLKQIRTSAERLKGGRRRLARGKGRRGNKNTEYSPARGRNGHIAPQRCRNHGPVSRFIRGSCSQGPSRSQQ